MCSSNLEYVDGAGRLAAERFGPGLPWLIGVGSGTPVEVDVS
jgi:hypothetical protein